jgi:hypothetical protein
MRGGTILDALKKAGMQVTELPPAELAKLRDKMKPVIAKHSAGVGEPTVNDRCRPSWTRPASKQCVARDVIPGARAGLER